MNISPELLTLASLAVAVFGILISLLLSMKEWRKEHREDIQKMDTNIRAMETKWDNNMESIRSAIKESDKRWFMLLEKMHMLDKDVDKLKAKN